MANQQITIDVHVDFQGVYFVPAHDGIDDAWSQPPRWIVQQEVLVTGPTDITWQLKPANVPPGLSAVFANGVPGPPDTYDRVNPIQFLPPEKPAYPYVPVRGDDGLSVTVSDDCTTLGTFEYYIWVVLADATGNHKAPAFAKDPDIKNDGGKKKYTIAHSAS